MRYGKFCQIRLSKKKRRQEKKSKQQYCWFANLRTKYKLSLICNIGFIEQQLETYLPLEGGDGGVKTNTAWRQWVCSIVLLITFTKGAIYRGALCHPRVWTMNLILNMRFTQIFIIPMIFVQFINWGNDL